MRKKIVAGNWKMNKDYDESKHLVTKLLNSCKPGNAEVIIAPPFINLLSSIKILEDSSIKVAAQNMHYADSGAYTGEISGSMLKSIGVNTTLIGHSERRAYYHENDELLLKKLNLAVENKMKVIFCFGEELSDRKSEMHFDVVKNQLKNTILKLDESSINNIVLAYEPVWAIGTGKTASAEQAESMHRAIRTWLHDKYDEETAQSVSLLYGGSCNHENARELFSCPNVDGGLIGGASLKSEVFCEIIKSY